MAQKFEVNSKSNLIYIHSYTSEIGHTCAAIEPFQQRKLAQALGLVLAKANCQHCNPHTTEPVIKEIVYSNYWNESKKKLEHGPAIKLKWS